MNHRIAAIILVALLGLAGSPRAFAVTWDEAKTGETVRDAEIRIGRFTIALPEGEWFVAAKGRDQEAGWSTQAAPLFLSLAVARVDAGKVAAVLTFFTLANSANAVWNDGPCRLPNVLYEDRTGSNFKYPQCLVVAKSPHQQWGSAGPKTYFGRVAKALIAYPAEMADQGLQVRYVRSYRQDHLRVDAFLPGFTAEGMQPVVGWATQMRAAVNPQMEGDATRAVLPAIPTAP